MDRPLDNTPALARSSNIVFLPTRTVRAIPATSTVVALLPKCAHSAPSPASNSARMGRVLFELYHRQQMLRDESVIALGWVADGRHLMIDEVLQLYDQQLSFGRRDPDLCGRMLRNAFALRNRIAEHCRSSRESVADTDYAVELAINIDRGLAQHLMGLMELAADYHPDESAYSLALRECLQLHIEDLRLVIEADLQGTPLEAPHYGRHPRVRGYFEE